jgi:hypothetical protein
MHVCTFKKLKHGGLREICVLLGIPERIIQLVIQTIAKAMFPFKTMTNPGHKASKYHLHDAETTGRLL